MARIMFAIALSINLATTIQGAEKWADEFNEFSLERWTPQTNGLQFVDAPPPDGVRTKSGVVTILDQLRGARLTSRNRFLYGTLEARVRISQKGLQYVGFMSRSPWAANTVMCMSIPNGHGWEMVMSRDRKGGHAGFGKSIEAGKWAILKIDWRPEQLTLDVDGKRIGKITDPTRIPSKPLPLILDTYARNSLELDYLRVTNTTIVKSAGVNVAPAPQPGPIAKIVTDHWAIAIDAKTRVPTKLTQLHPKRLTWTPTGSAAVDLYVRGFESAEPIRFSLAKDVAPFRPFEESRKSPSALMQPHSDPWKGKIAAELIFDSSDAEDLIITAEFKALQKLDKPVEIGLGIPFSPDQWERIAMPRLPWFQLSPRQSSSVRLPFLADPNDATVTSDAGSWVHYPFGILQNSNSSVFWGSMDIGKRVVLAPGNHGCGPALTLAPKTWKQGETKRLSIRLRAFPRSTTEVMRWYLSNCVSSDPLTKDLFPVRDWTPRTLRHGGVGMPDIRISRVNKKADPAYFDRVTDMLKKYHVSNLWFGTFHNINGSYPTDGQWICPTALDVSATDLKAELARMKELGLRPCLYTFQFITPELLRSDTIPSRDWVLHDILGDLFKFDTFRAGEKRYGAEWFTKDLAKKIGSDTVTWANVDFGRQEVRDFFFKSITKAIEFYEPSGICFDYGWGVLSANATYSPANPKTSQPHGRLRLQADVYHWIQKNHLEMIVLINDVPGSPSQLFANCQLVENSEVMSDLDIEAGRALSSAMSSMDYYTDHDELRWARQAMSNLSRGCSIGMPFWIPINGPDDYVNTWQSLYDFSAQTTALPIVPNSRSVSSDQGSLIKGTVWANKQKQLVAAMDHRTNGKERLTTLTVDMQTLSPKNRNWRITRLSNRVQPIKVHGWKTNATNDGSKLKLNGPLRPGEIILIEPAGQ